MRLTFSFCRHITAQFIAKWSISLILSLFEFWSSRIGGDSYNANPFYLWDDLNTHEKCHWNIWNWHLIREQKSTPFEWHSMQQFTNGNVMKNINDDLKSKASFRSNIIAILCCSSEETFYFSIHDFPSCTYTMYVCVWECLFILYAQN